MKLVTFRKVYWLETYSKFHLNKYLCDTFPFQNCLKTGDDLSPCLFNFAAWYSIRKVQEQEKLRLKGTRQLQVSADINLVGENIILQRETQKFYKSLVRGWSINKGWETKCIFVSCQQNTGQNYSIWLANKSVADVAEFGYLGTTMTKRNCMHDRADSFWWIPVTIRSRTFHLPVFCLKVYVACVLYGWKLGLSHEGKNVGWGCWRIGRGGKYCAWGGRSNKRQELIKVSFSAPLLLKPRYCLQTLASYKTRRSCFDIDIFVNSNWVDTRWQYKLQVSA